MLRKKTRTYSSERRNKNFNGAGPCFCTDGGEISWESILASSSIYWSEKVPKKFGALYFGVFARGRFRFDWNRNIGYNNDYPVQKDVSNQRKRHRNTNLRIRIWISREVQSTLQPSPWNWSIPQYSKGQAYFFLQSLRRGVHKTSGFSPKRTSRLLLLPTPCIRDGMKNVCTAHSLMHAKLQVQRPVSRPSQVWRRRIKLNTLLSVWTAEK